MRLCRATGSARVSELLAKLLAQQVGVWRGDNRGGLLAQVLRGSHLPTVSLPCASRYEPFQGLAAVARTLQATSWPLLSCHPPGA